MLVPGPRCGASPSRQMPPTKVPGRKIRAGSKRSLTRAITASAPASGAAQACARSALRRVEQRAGARRERVAHAGHGLRRHGEPEQAEAGAADEAAARLRRRAGGRGQVGDAAGDLDDARVLRRAPRAGARAGRSHSSSSSAHRLDLLEPGGREPLGAPPRPGAPRPRRRSAAAAGRRRRASPRPGSRPPAAGRRARRRRRRGGRGRPSRRSRSRWPSGSGCSRTAIRTIRPSVPSEPVNSFAEVVAGDVLDHLAARAGQRAVRQRHRRADHEVAHASRSGGAAGPSRWRP